jgi:hypothetical protein
MHSSGSVAAPRQRQQSARSGWSAQIGIGESSQSDVTIKSGAIQSLTLAAYQLIDIM